MLPAMPASIVVSSEPPPRRSAQQEEMEAGETMTAGMTTQKLDKSQVSLPRAGLGALLAATLLAGALIGAAAYAGIGAATAQPAAVTIDAVARPGARCARQLPLQPADQRHGAGRLDGGTRRFRVQPDDRGSCVHRAARSLRPSVAGSVGSSGSTQRRQRLSHRSTRQAMGSAASARLALSAPARIQTPCTAEIRPLLIAASSAAWSRSFWSAYASANVAIAWSNASSVPR